MEIKSEDVKNLKIVPEKFESSTVFDIVEIKDDQVKIKIPLIFSSDCVILFT